MEKFELKNPIPDEIVEELKRAFGSSIQYGLHTDDAPPNEGLGYVVPQVMETLFGLKSEHPELDPMDPATIIQATAILVEMTIAGGQGYTTNLPFGYPDWYTLPRQG